ncbi:CLUMA_CG013233, isoform A [Clunio marinus]|uniref:CLUMA_CG013233, isoform A n=1 Tax=Clunio marinus TaxID=568069 RepID=A0A1J1ILI1_9DIPT|nr:CLUMA_CG013233, isoform A [Clunio marinus]
MQSDETSFHFNSYAERKLESGVTTGRVFGGGVTTSQLPYLAYLFSRRRNNKYSLSVCLLRSLNH